MHRLAWGLFAKSDVFNFAQLLLLKPLNFFCLCFLLFLCKSLLLTVHVLSVLMYLHTLEVLQNAAFMKSVLAQLFATFYIIHCGSLQHEPWISS